MCILKLIQLMISIFMFRIFLEAEDEFFCHPRLLWCIVVGVLSVEVPDEGCLVTELGPCGAALNST